MRNSTIPSLLLGLFLFCFSFSNAQYEVGKQISEREAIALLELRAKTKGNQWTNKWDTDIPISQWHGVDIRDGKVVGLDLSDNNLQGKIPITIGNLRNLEYLDLSKNNISGKMPRLFRKLKNLRTVDLGENKLAGNIPNTINKLYSLEELNLSNNQLKGALPKNIKELRRLKTLALANNNLTGEMPAGMENLKKLKKLYLANNEFTDLNGLRELSKQQTVLTDFSLKDGVVLPVDFNNSEEGLSKLNFEDDE